MPCTDCSGANVLWFSLDLRQILVRSPDPLVLILPTVNCVMNPFACFVMTFSTSDTFQVKILNKIKTERAKLDIMINFFNLTMV